MRVEARAEMRMKGAKERDETKIETATSAAG